MDTGSEEAIRWTVGQATLAMEKGRPLAMHNEIVSQSEPQVWTKGSLGPFSGCRMIVDGTDVVVAVGSNSRAIGSGKIVRVSLNNKHASDRQHRTQKSKRSCVAGSWPVVGSRARSKEWR